MKTLILYYSLDGNTEFIARKIQEKLNCTIEKIESRKALVNPDSFMKYIWGGRMVIMKEVPDIFDIKNKINDFDNIIIGTPVWAWTYSPPIEAIFEKYEIKGKKVAIFCCHGGGPGKTLQKMKEKLSNNEIIGGIDFRDPLRKDTDKQISILNKWIENISISLDN